MMRGSHIHAIGEDRHDEGSHRHATGEDRHDEGGWVYPHAEKTEGAKFIYPSNIHTIILHTYTTNNKNQEWKKLSSIRYSHDSSAIGM